MAIKRLSDGTINLIAAGEVVERPASVVKELVENSIDAGAKVIDVYLEEAGKNLISVSDNGFGMSRDDMLLAVERHTTSKLDEEDILNINSFGFRGEALPSIASVSRFSIVSKQAEKDEAFKLDLQQGSNKIHQTLHDQGTKIEAADLFYSVPARLKFLKSNQTELAACAEVVKKLALASPSIAFSVIHGDKVLLKLAPAADIKTRILDVLSQDFAKNSIEVTKSDDGPINVYGYISLPTYHRASSDEQFIFVNNRPVRDKLVSACIKAAYQDYIVQGRFPSLVLFIEVPLRMVDVNVHPAKSEVRFQDSAQVRSCIIKNIKNAIQSSAPATASSIVDKAFSYVAPANHFEAYNSRRQLFDDNYPYRSSPAKVSSTLQPEFLQPKSLQQEPAKVELEKASISMDASHHAQAELGMACAQLHNNYIVAQSQDGVVIVDQHAAHERIVYEELKKNLQKQPINSQQLLIPIALEFNIHKANCLTEHQEHLQQLGLKFKQVSDTKIIIEEVPTILAASDIKQLILDIADEISQDGQEFSLTRFREHVIETYACHHSIRSGQKLSIDEMNRLLRQMEVTPGSSQCCHGRPTYVKLSLVDMEKLFSRR